MLIFSACSQYDLFCSVRFHCTWICRLRTRQSNWVTIHCVSETSASSTWAWIQPQLSGFRNKTFLNFFFFFMKLKRSFVAIFTFCLMEKDSATKPFQIPLSLSSTFSVSWWRHADLHWNYPRLLVNSKNGLRKLHKDVLINKILKRSFFIFFYYYFHNYINFNFFFNNIRINKFWLIKVNNDTILN